MAADRAHAARHGRYLGAADGHRLQPRHDERDLSISRAGRCHDHRVAEMAQGLAVPRRRQRDLLVRAGKARQVLAAQRTHRDGAEHPQGRRGFDRRRRGDPARLFQHRLVRRAVLAQPRARPARDRSGAAQLRPDAARYRPVPARLRELPRDRGSPRRTSSTSSSRRGRPTCGKARGLPSPRRSTRSSIRNSATARSRSAGQVFARTCAGCHSSQSQPVRQHRLPRHRSERSDAAARLPQQRAADLGQPRRHLCGPRACIRTTWRAASGINMPRATCTSARPIRPSRK